MHDIKQKKYNFTVKINDQESEYFSSNAFNVAINRVSMLEHNSHNIFKNLLK